MDLQHALHRLRLALGIGKVRLTDDTGPVHLLQLQLSAAETRDATPQVLTFGFSSHPPAGSDVVYVSLGGDRSQTIAIGTNHPQSRPRNVAQGGSVQHDQGGSRVLLNNDGTIQLVPSGGVVTVAGSLLVTGEVTAQTAGNAVHLSTHTHNQVSTGIAHTGHPDPNT